MTEWHVTPDYISNNWTDELLNLMVDKLIERKEREEEAVRQISNRSESYKVSDTELFSRMGKMVKVVNN